MFKVVPVLNWHRLQKEPLKKALTDVEDCSESDRCSKPDGTYLCCPYNNGTCCGVHGYCWFVLKLIKSQFVSNMLKIDVVILGAY